MFQIRKKNIGVLIHASVLEDVAKEQIETISKHPAFREKIAIMPDAHAGAGCVIGFTGKFDKAVIPNIVGVDIGCGVLTYRLKIKNIDFAKLDTYIRDHIPTGFNSRSYTDMFQALEDTLFGDEVEDYLEMIGTAESFISGNELTGNPKLQIGTLGGGNHFLEIEKGSEGELYLTVHSGSRNFGLQVANFYQKKAKLLMEEMNIDVPKDLEYLPMSAGGSDYLQLMQVAQHYAYYNRMVMLRIILKYLNEDFEWTRTVESVHNYIGKDGIIRKGAISAYKNELVVIPLSMGSGIVLGIGKGNPDYNNSAPHGAGRIEGRKSMMRKLSSGIITMDEYRKSMEGIFSTSINEKTIDESPIAYKKLEDIETHLRETVDIEQIAKPVYNLKADGE